VVEGSCCGSRSRSPARMLLEASACACRRKSRAAAGAEEEEPAAEGRMSIQDLQHGVPSSPALPLHGLDDAQFQLDSEGAPFDADLAAAPHLPGAAAATPFAAPALQARARMPPAPLPPLYTPCHLRVSDADMRVDSCRRRA
jgi:hypothetical protein